MPGSQDVTPQTYADEIVITTMPTRLQVTPGITPKPDLVTAFKDTVKPISETGPEVILVTTSESPIKALDTITVKHEEVVVVSESKLLITERTSEDSTSRKYDYEIPTTFKDSLGINTPIVLTSEFSEEMYSETGQGFSDGTVKTVAVTIQQEFDIVSKSTLLTTKKTPEVSTSREYEHDIPTNFGDSSGISTNTPTVTPSELKEDLHSESEQEAGQDVTHSPVKTTHVTIKHEVLDAKTTLMTTDRIPYSISVKYEHAIPTSFEDSLRISTTELTSETVKEDVTDVPVKTAYVTISHGEAEMVTESTLTTTNRNLEDSTSGKYDYEIPTSQGISTFSGVISESSTEELTSVTKLDIGQGTTEGSVKTVEAVQYVQSDVVSEATLKSTGRTPVSLTSTKTETSLFTTPEDLTGVSTNTPEIVTRDSITNFIPETEDVTESPVKSAPVTIQHVAVDDVLAATVMSTDKPPKDSSTEIYPAQNLLPEEPELPTPTKPAKVSPATEGLPKDQTDKNDVTIVYVPTVPELPSPTTPAYTSTDIAEENLPVSTGGTVVTLLDKDEEEDTPHKESKPTQVTTGADVPGTTTESTHGVWRETHEPINVKDVLITEISEVAEVPAGGTPKMTEETTKATESVFTVKDTTIIEDKTGIVKPGMITTEAAELTEDGFEESGTDKVTILENMLEDFVGLTSESIAISGDVTEATTLEESYVETTESVSGKEKSSETSTKITGEPTTDDIDTPETDIVEPVTDDIEDNLNVSPKNDNTKETLLNVFEDTTPDLTVTKTEKDIMATTIDEDIHEVTEPSKFPEVTHKVVVEITDDVRETRGDSLPETPEVTTETPKVATEADVKTTTNYVISKAPEVILKTTGAMSETPEITSQTPLLMPEDTERVEIVPETPDIQVVQTEHSEVDIPTPVLKVEDITVALNDLTTPIQKTFSTTLQQDISNDILDENNVVSTSRF